MSKAEQYRAEAERARQMGRDAQKDADELVLNKPDASESDQKAAEEKYDAMRAAFTKANEWDERATAADKADAADRLLTAQRERNRLPLTEPASATSGSTLNDAPTVMELVSRSRAFESGNIDLAAKRWPVENLFLLAVRDRCHDGRIMTAEQREAWADYERTAEQATFELALTPTQQVKTDAAGGVLVPEYLDRMIRDKMVYEGPLADDSLISVLRTNSTGVMKLPVNDDIETKLPARLEEATDATIQETAFSEVTLTPENFAIQMVLTDQILLGDVISIEPYLARKVGENFGRRQNAFFTSGTGTNQPKGVTRVAAGRKVSVAANTGVTETDVQNLKKLLDFAYHLRPSTRVMAHQGTIFDLMILRDSTGGNLVFQRTPDGLGVLLGGNGPVMANNRLNERTAGSSNTEFEATDQIMVMADLSDYTKVQVGALRFERERMLRSYQWLVGWNTYLDATPVVENAYAVLTGKT